MNPGRARRVGLAQRVGERINMDGYLAGGGSLSSAAGWRMVRAEGRRGHDANRLHDRRGSGTRSARRNLQPSQGNATGICALKQRAAWQSTLKSSSGLPLM